MKNVKWGFQESWLKGGADSTGMPSCPLLFLFPAACSAAMMAAVEKLFQKSAGKAKRIAENSES